MQRPGQFGGRPLVDLLHPARVLAHHVVFADLAEIDLIEAGPIEKIRAAHQMDLLEGGHAAVDRHQVAAAGAEGLVDLLDAGRAPAGDQRGQDRPTGAGDPQAGGL